MIIIHDLDNDMHKIPLHKRVLTVGVQCNACTEDSIKTLRKPKCQRIIITIIISTIVSPKNHPQMKENNSP